MRQFPFEIRKEFSLLKKLRTPAQVQDFLEGIPINFERERETCRSPRYVLRRNKAHCLEGALVAAAAFWYQGRPPLLLDLKTTEHDLDHVVALFKEDNRWGAVSKTNHAVLRYRDPIYETVRELALSYFNEYFLDDGVKTLRSYSAPFNLLRMNDDWLTSRKNLWDISDALDNSPHFNILKKGAARRLRLADPIERKAGRLVQWRRK